MYYERELQAGAGGGHTYPFCYLTLPSKYKLGLDDWMTRNLTMLYVILILETYISSTFFYAWIASIGLRLGWLYWYAC